MLEVILTENLNFNKKDFTKTLEDFGFRQVGLDRLLDVSEYAKTLGVTKGHIYNSLANNKELPTKPIRWSSGTKVSVRFSEIELQQWIKKQRGKGR